MGTWTCEVQTPSHSLHWGRFLVEKSPHRHLHPEVFTMGIFFQKNLEHFFGTISPQLQNSTAALALMASSLLSGMMIFTPL